MLAREGEGHEYAPASDCTPAMSSYGEPSSAVRDHTEMPAGEATTVRGPMGTLSPYDTHIPVPAAESHGRPSTPTPVRLATA